VLAGFLGWTLDAFDFFVVVFLFDTLAHQFGVTKTEIVWTTTATLAIETVGALLFGLLSDRMAANSTDGERDLFSIIELACGFAPISRCSWCCGRCRFRHGRRVGVGASLAMEAGSTESCAGFERMLQSGLFDRIFARRDCGTILLPMWGWRPCFWIGALPALLALYIRTKVPESEAWSNTCCFYGRSVARRCGAMAAVPLFGSVDDIHDVLSHGTQDLYPDFLQEVHKVSAASRANMR